MFKPLRHLIQSFERLPYAVRLLALVLGVVVLGVVDLALPPYVILSGFYYLPIFLAAFTCSRQAAYLVALLAWAINAVALEPNYPEHASALEHLVSTLSLGLSFLAFVAVSDWTRQLVSQLIEENMFDFTSGAYNQRALERALRRETARFRHSQVAFGLAVLDIDHFARLNFQYGQRFGDIALSDIARAIQRGLRDIDVLTRLRDNRFVMVLPHADLAVLDSVLARVRAQVVQAMAIHDPQVTASIGAVLVDQLDDGDDEPTLLRLAEDRLAQAKRQGKNCCVSLSLRALRHA
ncbi:GGDEF domain-containing protein [Massilia sp. TS11]|uniref:GGDEF domain-containing protein n=1 Tax=Massilia sp. TS11 TaxID=2908003 RepID=UPI001EDC6C46|nr:GGDEF domain-containing protein [Massilia sp. TS11]MCG2586194.1 GGDEF domain-containing protein [Massilia sp. TS11]